MFSKTTNEKSKSPTKTRGASIKSIGGDQSMDMSMTSPMSPGRGGQRCHDEHISKVQMKSLLQSEYTDEKLNKGFDDCCGSIKPCSENIAKIAVGIEELYNLNPSQIVGNVVEMEESI